MSLRFLDRLQPIALVALRVGLGVIMIAHGYPKVFGGMQKHAEFVATLGMPAWLAYLSAAAELLGGILLLAGLLTRLAALAITIDLAVAIAKVHWKNGFTGTGNYQFPLAIAVGTFALIFFGSGPVGLDWLLGRRSGGK